MTGWEVAGTLLLSIVANEMWDVSSWCAERVVRAATRMRYPDGERREVRLAELSALVASRPGKVFRLLTALGFLLASMPAGVKRAVAGRAHGKRRVALIALAAVGVAAGGTVGFLGMNTAGHREPNWSAYIIYGISMIALIGNMLIVVKYEQKRRRVEQAHRESRPAHPDA